MKIFRRLGKIEDRENMLILCKIQMNRSVRVYINIHVNTKEPLMKEGNLDEVKKSALSLTSSLEKMPPRSFTFDRSQMGKSRVKQKDKKAQCV